MDYGHTVPVQRFAFVVFFAQILYGQSIEIPPATATRGAAQIFRIAFKARADRPIASLQWEIVCPASLQIEVAGVVSGSVAESAGKTLACASRKSAPGEKVLSCVLAGGVKPLPEGTVAIVRFVPAANAPKKVFHIRLEKIVGVSPKLDQVVIPGTSGEITVKVEP